MKLDYLKLSKFLLSLLIFSIFSGCKTTQVPSAAQQLSDISNNNKHSSWNIVDNTDPINDEFSFSAKSVTLKYPFSQDEKAKNYYMSISITCDMKNDVRVIFNWLEEMASQKLTVRIDKQQPVTFKVNIAEDNTSLPWLRKAMANVTLTQENAVSYIKQLLDGDKLVVRTYVEDLDSKQTDFELNIYGKTAEIKHMLDSCESWYW